MAISATPVEGAHTVWGNKRVRVYTLAFSGTYTSNGEVVLASTVGLTKIEQVIPNGAVAADDEAAPATGSAIGVYITANGDKAYFSLFQSAADGDPFDEMPAEAVTPENGNFRVTFIGF